MIAPMAKLTPREAAEQLGIADEHVEAFVRIVAALRAPEARDAALNDVHVDLIYAYAAGQIEQAAFERVQESLNKLTAHL